MKTCITKEVIRKTIISTTLGLSLFIPAQGRDFCADYPEECRDRERSYNVFEISPTPPAKQETQVWVQFDGTQDVFYPDGTHIQIPPR